MVRLLAVLIAAFTVFSVTGWAAIRQQDASVYLTRPEDDHAPTFDAAFGDGRRDCTAALQQAIDTLQSEHHHGILFIPSGRYRLSGTVYVWTGIRLIGFGERRPVFLLPDGVPGFDGAKPRYLFHFAHERPAAGAPVQDGTSETFYSGMSNIDFEIGERDPAAVAIRFHVAQHGILSHMQFHVGSAHAALMDVGNVASDLHIVGGDYGMDTGKTAPGWQFVLMDSVIEGQRRAAIRTHEAGMTLVRVAVRNVPVGIDIPDGQIEELYLRDSSFTSIEQAALHPGDVLNVRSQISADNLLCRGVHQFFAAADGLPEYAPRGSYTVDRLRIGVQLGPDGRSAGFHFDHREHAGVSEMPATDVPALPPVSTWTNVRKLGAFGDGMHDDTAALQKAITDHAALYFPAGRYRLTGTLHLRPDSVLVGLHPFVTQLVLAPYTPQFAGDGPMIPLVESPAGGTDVISGIGISTGTFNPRAAGIVWKAGARSMIEDVKFIGGRGTLTEDDKPLRVYPEPPGKEPDRSEAWNRQYPSLIIHGGGIFRAIWSASTFARAGLVIEDTEVPGRIFGFSCEHHLKNEVEALHAANWRILALQTEEEKLEGKDAVALMFQDAREFFFGNLFHYRVSRSLGPADHAISVAGATDAEFANVHVFAGGRYAFDHSVLDERSGVRSRVREFASFATAKPLIAGSAPDVPAVFVPRSLKTLATGLTDITGLVPAKDGDLQFTDALAHRLLQWNASSGHISMLKLPADAGPVVLAGNLLLDAAGHVTDQAGTQLEPIAPSSGVLLLPAGGHSGIHALEPFLAAQRGFALDRDGAILPVAKDMRPLLYASQFALFRPGTPHLLVSEDDARVYRFTTTPRSAELVAEVPGSSVVEDIAGNIYIAGDQLFVLNRNGQRLGTLELPSRPTALAIGGAGDRTLFIGARDSLYAIQLAEGH